MLVGSAIFGDNNEYWVIISLILVGGISYFRFKGREISKGKVKEAKVKKEKRLLLATIFNCDLNRSTEYLIL